MGHEAKFIYLLAYCNWHFSLIMTIILWFRLAIVRCLFVCKVRLDLMGVIPTHTYLFVHKVSLDTIYVIPLTHTFLLRG